MQAKRNRRYRFRIILKMLIWILALAGCSAEQKVVSEAEKALADIKAFTDQGDKYGQGVDVSHWNGTVDWSEIKEGDVAFAFIKVSEGKTFADPELSSNWESAQKNKILVGGYHVYTPGDGGAAQAKNFLNTLHNVEQGYIGNLPPVLDVEKVGTAAVKVKMSEIQSWLDTVERSLGCTPIIYTSPANWNSAFPGEFSSYPLWLADYTPPPTMPTGWQQWLFWQYTNKGTIPRSKKSPNEDGSQPDTENPIDLDMYAGSPADLIRSTCTGGL